MLWRERQSRRRRTRDCMHGIPDAEKRQQRAGLGSESNPGVQVNRAIRVGEVYPGQHEWYHEYRIEAKEEQQHEVPFHRESVGHEPVSKQTEGAEQDDRILSLEGWCRA